MIRANYNFPMLLVATIMMLSWGCSVKRGMASQKDNDVHKPAPDIHFYKIENNKKIPTAKRHNGDITSIEITGLNAGQTYRLTATSKGFGKITKRSWIDVVATKDGSIDSSTAEVMSGTYTGVDVDGLFWSMMDSPNALPPATGSRISVEQNNNVLISADLPFELIDKDSGVRTVEVKVNGLVGVLFLPKPQSGVTHPALILLSGSEGGLQSTYYTAGALADQGYIALSLAWFGAPGVPADLANIPLEYFQTAIHWLGARSEVDKTKIGVLGSSRGGELALLIGSLFPEIRAVVANVPSPYRWGGNVESGNTPPAWLYRNQPLAFLDSMGELEKIILPDGSEAFANGPAFIRGFDAATSEQREAAISTIEKTNGPILMIAGSDDHMWPSCFLIDKAMERLKFKSHSFNDESLCVQNAGHGVTMMPGFSTTDLAFVHPQMNVRVAMGGTPRDNAHGQRAAWNRTLQFLEKAFR